MGTSRPTRNNKQIYLSLLGINKTSSTPELTKAQKKIDIFCLILICIGAGYFATIQGFDSLPMNADTLAPFEEAKSLIRNPATHLFNIHVSRIPSIFPDITINALLQLIHPKAGFLEIFSLYSWCTSSLFLLLATILTNEIRPSHHTFTANSIKISLITISLLNISHQFNIAYAHILTPVHHGGNVLNTILLIILALKLLKKPKHRWLQAGFLSLIFLAAMSNKLSVFTAVGPIACIFIIHLQGHTRNKHLLQLIIITSAGLFVGSLLNEQCASAKFDLSKTFLSFQDYFKLSWITSASAIVSAGSLLYVIKAKPELQQTIRAGLTAISLSSLSYFAYLPILTGRGQAPLRYICTAYILIIIFLVFYINTFNAKYRLSALIMISLITIISFQSPVGPYLNLTAHQSLKQDLLDRSERIEPFKHDAAEFIHKMDYDSYLGLGEYWMTSATLLSNSKIYILPILSSGKPDFWGATPKDIREYIKPHQDGKAYLLSDNDKFKEKFEKRYGPAKISWNYDIETRQFTQDATQSPNRLLIYNNPEIYSTIRKKSKHFKRQCNRSLPNYKKR